MDHGETHHVVQSSGEGPEVVRRVEELRGEAARLGARRNEAGPAGFGRRRARRQLSSSSARREREEEDEGDGKRIGSRVDKGELIRTPRFAATADAWRRRRGHAGRGMAVGEHSGAQGR